MSTNTEFLSIAETWAKLYFFKSLTDFFNHLKQTELSILQAYALTFLDFKGPIKTSALCEHMNVSPAAATQMVDRLEKLGMVTRAPDPNDRRVRNIVVTENGKRFVQTQFESSQQWLTKIPAGLSNKQEDEITALLSLLIQGIQASGETI